MNNSQRAKLDTCNRVNSFNAKHATTLNTIVEYAFEQAAFSIALNTINTATQVQSGTQGTTSDAVQIAKEVMAKTVVKYALRALVKAKQTDNVTLANHLDHGTTYILQTTKTLAVLRAKDIRDQLSNNLATLTNITPENIIEIDSAINAYDVQKDSPTIQIQERVATGTNPLPDAYKTAFKAIENMYGLISSYFIDTNRPLVDEFILAKQIITTGVRHTGVTGTVFKEGHPLKDTIITIVGTKKVTQTDMEGHYAISGVKTGDYTIEAKSKTGEVHTKTVHITKANFEVLDFAI
jgi:Carboxypeptidase regulatory-like domain